MKNIKAKLIELGMQEAEVDELIKKDLEGYVTTEVHETVKGQLKIYEDNSTELKKTIKELQKEADMSEVLKAKVEKLEKDNEEKDNKIARVIFDNKLDNTLKETGAKNLRAVKALLNLDDVKIENDALVGLDAQLTALKESDSYLFAEDKPSLGSLGGHPRGGTNVKNPFSKEHFNITEQCRLMKENPTLAEQYRALAEGK